jgi:hypothetical protein
VNIERGVNMGKRIFGEIEGYPEGTIFDSRKALNKAGLHRPTMAGISGTAKKALTRSFSLAAMRTTSTMEMRLSIRAMVVATATLNSRLRIRSLFGVMPD